MYRNILVVLSEPRTGPHVLTEAVGLAQRGHGRLTLLCPVARPPAWLVAPVTVVACEPLARELEQEAEHLLCAARRTVPEDVPLTTILTRRPLRDALRQRLGEHPHDLLVLGEERIGRRLERCCPIPLHRVVPIPSPASEPLGAPARRRPALGGIELAGAS